MDKLVLGHDRLTTAFTRLPEAFVQTRTCLLVDLIYAHAPERAVTLLLSQGSWCRMWCETGPNDASEATQATGGEP